MWEDAMQPPQQQAPAPPKQKPSRSEDNLVLWAQLILCALALAGVLTARTLQMPLYAALRSGFDAAMAQTPLELFGEERGFVKFAQGGWQSLQQATAEVFAELTATDTTRARRSRGIAAPVGSSLQSWQLAQTLCAPLGAAAYTQTSTYGWRIDPVQGQGDEFHTGVDLAVAQGTPIYAAAAGVVRFAGQGRSYGNYLRLLHGGGDETLYAHMQYLFVRSGQQVQAGDCIGTVGQTGNVTGPHLHFELLHEGVRYDPTTALQSAS